jgi:ABC-type multidrug transport system fused ATPase/permease subunit
LNVKIFPGVVSAIIKDAKIFMFDEVFNLLDKRSIGNIMEILSGNKENHTIIILSKDESILVQSDNIIVIADNEVVGTGTHKDLLKNNIYKDIVAK